MHQTPVSVLVQRFESPEREAYQKPEEVLDYLGELEGKTVMGKRVGSEYFSVRLAVRRARVIAADVDDEFQAYPQQRTEEEYIEGVTPHKIPYDASAWMRIKLTWS